MVKRPRRKRANKTEDFHDGLKVINDLNDPFSFEKYCGGCDFFGTDDCQHIGKVFEDSEWRLITCLNFCN